MNLFSKSFRTIAIILVLLTLIQLPLAADAKTLAVKSSPMAESCGCELKPLPDVVATVNGTQIKGKDVLDALSTQIDQIQKQVTDARRVQLDLEINIRLLEDEARKKGISSAKLVQQEINSKVVMPTDAEVQAFYDDNRSNLQGDLKDNKASIIEYLRSQREQSAAEKLAYRLRAAGGIQVLVAEVTPPKNDSERSRTLATVNGKPITSGDVEDSLRPLVFVVQLQVFKLIVDSVSLIVNDTLLQQEAKKRNTTPKDLITLEVDQKAKKVSEADAQAFYNQNKAQIVGEYNAVKTQLIGYLQDQESDKAANAFVERLRQGAAIKTFLTAPDPPTYAIAVDDKATKGKATAPITLVEFTDYQCPDCQRAQPIIEAMATKYGDNLRIVIRNFPLSKHNNAFKAAEAAEAARAQGKYWEYVAILFQNQNALSIDNLKTYATKVGIDRKAFDAALDSGQYFEKVQTDLMDGQKIGVGGTPSVYINGRPVLNVTTEGLTSAIDATLAKLGKK